MSREQEVIRMEKLWCRLQLRGPRRKEEEAPLRIGVLATTLVHCHAPRMTLSGFSRGVCLAIAENGDELWLVMTDTKREAALAVTGPNSEPMFSSPKFLTLYHPEKVDATGAVESGFTAAMVAKQFGDKLHRLRGVHLARAGACDFLQGAMAASRAEE